MKRPMRCACSFPVALVAVSLGGLFGSAYGDQPVPAQPAAKYENKNRPRPVDPGFVLPEAMAAEVEAKMTDPAFVLGYEMPRITGEPEHLMRYLGEVVLLVNVASKCGFTKQYDGLEKLYRAKRDEGFVVLGFPANNFGEQEPGSNAEIMEFCTGRHDVSFPMFSKISVLGDDQHPLYERLAALPEPNGGGPRWNFTKYLVGRDGRVIAKFDSRVGPDDRVLTDAVRKALEAPKATAG